jgi:hypothetical protein
MLFAHMSMYARCHNNTIIIIISNTIPSPNQPIRVMNATNKCLRCHQSRSQCMMVAANNVSCKRCRKYLFPCVFSPPPPPSPTPAAPTPSVYPSWTHQFAAKTNSSNRVRAAAVAFLATEQNETQLARSADRMDKKKAKQEKYLLVADIPAATGITAEEIKHQVIVFDGTNSDPPPPISPPSNVSKNFVSELLNIKAIPLL